MKKIIQISFFTLIFFILSNFSYAIIAEPFQDINKKVVKEKIEHEIKVGDNTLNYNIGFNNEIPENGSFFVPIKLSFIKDFNGTLKIYKVKDRYDKEIIEQKDNLLKEIKIDGNNINTYFYKESYSDYHFYLNSGEAKTKLEVYNLGYNDRYNNSTLWLIDKDYDIGNLGPYIYELNDDFELNGYLELNINKNVLSEKEKDIIENFLIKGGSVIKGGKTNKKYIEQLDYNSINSILIDDNIKSKYVPFYIILIVIILYFILLIPINFIIYKKKKNKFFLVYSIPAISFCFLLILVLMNVFYKGTSDIENKLEINYHKDGKILKEVNILEFTPYGGEFEIIINKEDYIKNNNYSYSYNYRKNKNISYKSGINTKFENIYSSDMIRYKYGKVINDTSEEKQYDETYNNLDDFLKKYNKNTSYSNYGFYPGKLPNSEIIKKIGVKKEKTEYMDKYSFGGKSSYNLVIDVFYK